MLSLADLSAAERRVWDAFPEGETVTFAARSPEEENLTKGTVSLIDGKVGRLADEENSWPDHLKLNGLVYESIIDVGVTGRLDWLNRSGEHIARNLGGRCLSLQSEAGQAPMLPDG
ncbi:MAG: hypothetical protein ABSA53_34025 [Streptosporangiaceae bacterium]